MHDYFKWILTDGVCKTVKKHRENLQIKLNFGLHKQETLKKKCNRYITNNTQNNILNTNILDIQKKIEKFL